MTSNDARAATFHLSDLLRRERETRAEFLLALTDFDRRRLWIALGHTSLFAYLTRELRLSKASAFFRKASVDLLHRFPDLIDPIRDGRLSLSVLPAVARLVTPENRDALVPRFFGLSRREARELEAELTPVAVPPLRDVVTELPGAAGSPGEPPRPQSVRADPAPAATAERTRQASAEAPPLEANAVARAPPPSPPAAPRDPEVAVPPPAPAAPPRDEVVPLTATLARLHTTVSRDVLRKLEAARIALAHARPGATTGEVIGAALDLLLAKQASRKGVVAKPRKAVRAPGGDPAYIPAEVRRSVWLRDGGRCQYRLASGEICGSSYALEFDHVRPSALGGASTVENVRVCCRAHNQRRAREVFGDAWMDRFTGRGTPQARAPP